MKAAPADLGPFFEPVKPQPNPRPKVQDLGIRMLWRIPRRTARLYRNIFDALADLERLLPPERHVTEEDIANLCRTLGKAKPSPPEPRADPPTGVLAKDLEAQGCRVTNYQLMLVRALLNIDWLPRPGGHQFFTGILEIRPTEDGVAGQWMLPGPCGVNHLLRREFEKLCAGPGTCLTPEGRRQCLAGIKPLRGRNPATQISAWPTNPFPLTPAATSSSSPSPTRSEPG
ncbi:MAG: hypothetical protein ABSH34_17830 [Verrucomicrobiota bacterium]|jgi:hypothetical protein